MFQLLNLSFTPFGYEVSFLNTTVTTAIHTRFNLKNKKLVKFILRIIGLPHFGARLRAYYLNKLLSHLAPSSRILDAGCGIGLNSFLLGRKGFTVVGVDSDKEKIYSAKHMLANFHKLSVQFKLGNLLDLKSENKNFDCVVCFEVLEHIENDKKALEEISKVLKQNGILILSVPGKGFISFINQQSKHHVREGYSLSEIRALLGRSNLSIKKAIGIEHTSLGLFLRLTNDALHKRSLFITTLSFFVFLPLAIIDGFLPKIITPQNWIILAKKQRRSL